MSHADALPPLIGPPGGAVTLDPTPLLRSGRNWTAWFGPLISLAILAVVFIQIGAFDFDRLIAMLPRTLLFWFVFAVTYSLTPLCDWIIFNRLWAIPTGGLSALFRKRISNELLLGYVGDVYFYAWARRNVKMAGSPFGAVKDSAILSGVMGNVVTLVMLLFTLPLLSSLRLAVDGRTLAISLTILVVTSFGPIIFGRKIFSLPKAQRRMVAGVHLARIVANVLLYAALWHLLLPEVAISWWFMLSTVRLVLSRLPLVPNKDVLFAGVAVFLVGRELEIAQVLAVIATLLLATHLLVGLLLGLSGLAKQRRTI
ncbi:hypothetical protein [Sphingobium algorifonticola]|uniref:Flippase-like domain-containing protein n=1 Tax=Sphingobium algorifonticola TaxID=2008318 RepID=A0A437JCQ2_9SPHN|nr:hypothetical protein [Sphingobium algorifonticola]RVT43667.1 hypothetical protein ENE74_03410 [Sphingobium algorifonticola]